MFGQNLAINWDELLATAHRPQGQQSDRGTSFHLGTAWKNGCTDYLFVLIWRLIIGLGRSSNWLSVLVLLFLPAFSA